MSLQRCTGCNCDLPVAYGSPNQFGQHKGPCCSDYSPGNLACGYAIVFGCEHPWWKHQVSTNFGRDPQPMLIPPGYYDGRFDSEPSATYKVTFLGRETSHGVCRYVQKEGLGSYPATRSDCAQEQSQDYDRNCASLYHRVCNLPNYTPNSSTGRHPYHLDSSGAMVQPSPMVLDLRFASGVNSATGETITNRLRQLFGGTDDDNPTCCWCNIIDDRNCGTCVVNWDGWTLHLTGNDNPFARSTPRLTYLEGLDAFWNEVGRPEPWYGIDSTFGTGAFDPWGPTQFALQNADYWPSLPARVCVYPVRWPFFNSPCDSEDEQCESCAPAITTAAGEAPLAGCGLQGFYLSNFTTCVGGEDGTLSGSIRPIGCGDPKIIGVYLPFRPELPSGVSDPGAACGYWFRDFAQGDETSCEDPQVPYWIGLLIYWNGSAWKVDTYCSDDGITYAQAGSAVVSNVVCTDIGVRFDFTATGVTCICCPCDCDTIPDNLTAAISSDDCPQIDGVSVDLEWDGDSWFGEETTGDYLVRVDVTCVDDESGVRLTGFVCLFYTPDDPDTACIPCDASFETGEIECNPFQATATVTSVEVTPPTADCEPCEMGGAKPLTIVFTE